MSKFLIATDLSRDDLEANYCMLPLPYACYTRLTILKSNISEISLLYLPYAFCNLSRPRSLALLVQYTAPLSAQIRTFLAGRREARERKRERERDSTAAKRASCGANAEIAKEIVG